jgi:hypothetical protein
MVIINQRPSDIAIKYNIPLHRINKYIRKFKNGSSLSSTNGRASLINHKEQEILLDVLQGTIATKKEDSGGLCLSQFKILVLIEVNRPFKQKCPINKFINNHHLFRQQAEESTNARHIAVYDIIMRSRLRQ